MSVVVLFAEILFVVSVLYLIIRSGIRIKHLTTECLQVEALKIQMWHSQFLMLFYRARLRSRFRLLISGILLSLPNPAWEGGNLAEWA